MNKSTTSLNLEDLFAYGFQKKKNELAVRDANISLDFEQLYLLSHRLAHLFIVRHKDENARVVVLSRKNVFMPVIAASLWKIGWVYVPVDGDGPEERNAKIIDAIQPVLIIGTEREREKYIGFDFFSFTEIENLLELATEDLPENRVSGIDINAPAYIIHTSGSTGEPKGVVISRRSLLDYFYSHNEILQFNRDSTVFRISPYHFDLSIEDTMLPLAMGSSVYIHNGMLLWPIVNKIFCTLKVTHLVAVSTALDMITSSRLGQDKPPVSLKTIVTGAEKCTPSTIETWLAMQEDVRLLNGYGPTEVTINAASFTISKATYQAGKPIPFGKAMTGIQFRLIDADGSEINSPGVSGELHIGGSQVMIEYYAKERETSEAIYIHNGTRFYRSGDHCMFDEKGDYYFLGRKDSEVKIEGKRFNLGEIESALAKSPLVDYATAGVVEIKGRKSISVVIRGNISENSISEISVQASNSLPDYMIPKYWGILAAYETTSTGKLDNRALSVRLSELIQRDPEKVVYTI